MKLKPVWLAITAAGVMVATAGVTTADWDPGDGHKMHYPQMPDPFGWDVEFTWPNVLADDWQCSQTGFVDDIHFWYSYQGDGIMPIMSVHASIHTDDRTGNYSRPGDLLWERDFQLGEFTTRHWGTGDQGWYDPFTGLWSQTDHLETFQCNIEQIFDPFWQEEGTIYWLDLSIVVDPGVHIGWKTSIDAFEDDAVYWDEAAGDWQRMCDPVTCEPLNLAFVITPAPGAMALLAVGGVLVSRRRRH